MNDRERFIARAALLYCISNLDDLNEAFEDDEAISVNGEAGERIAEEEIKKLFFTLQ